MLLLLVGFFLLTGCKDDGCPERTPPKWELPQPIDTLLLGSWKAIEVDGYLLGTGWFQNQEVTFYDNNRFVIVYEFDTGIYENEYRWSVNGDTLVMPDFYEYRTGRFEDYTYHLNADENLLYVNLINYPWVGNCDFTLEGTISAFSGTKVTFKKLEETE